MKTFKVLAFCAFMVVSGQSFAKNNPISFTKGSHCGSFERDYTNRTFTLNTKANQTIYVTIRENARDVEDIKIIDPKGRTTYADGAELDFTTKVKGVHKIKIIPYNDAGWANIEFCAY
ncbi:hypothetical protein LP123_12010 [Moraxella bovis]|uniref:Uncharacterized protein n=1 Tax=Moraxella bovis TaxID=476 RepID=A0AAQ2Q9B7_MORBO|nr:hypothetical protein [Moraxella bovis]AWY19472.1 hypothetical protein DQF64_02390 [Moraxella bovis]OOR87516.1 hypothetical protein B0182_12260 [Moraxella bovis]UYZ76186.1 hypothetical protein LP093_02345 [Moraxella bovis]UYZ77860.1 hypothetical protein LP115_11450 [Moraxella bovis]UYZ80755.1 hypothetical protein LP113_12130 [Moraxella bovis]